MTWPPNATRAEILRILEINRNLYTEWVITRAETEAILDMLVAERYLRRIKEACLESAERELDELKAAGARRVPGPKEGRDG